MLRGRSGLAHSLEEGIRRVTEMYGTDRKFFVWV